MSDRRLPLIHREPPTRWPNLIEAMQRAGFSLRQIAGAIGVPHTTVQYWLEGGYDDNGAPLRIPNAEDAKALLQLFRIVEPMIDEVVRIA